MGKTVKFEEIKKEKHTRLFSDRRGVDVDLPQKICDEYGVKSIIIEPMTHEDAEKRSLLKSKVGNAKATDNYKADIKEIELIDYISDHEKLYQKSERVNSLLPSMPDYEGKEDSEIDDITKEFTKKLDDVKESKLYKELKADYEKSEREHLEKWGDLIRRTKMRDSTLTHEAEAELAQNAFDIVNKYAKYVILDDGEKIELGNGKIIHPDFMYWILSEIEGISYLTENEIDAFQ